ncbi:T9SS type A sorting domain-containing protein [bacterium]|nr:T9SS type A sorting domain-containing protein [bacterium]
MRTQYIVTFLIFFLSPFNYSNGLSKDKIDEKRSKVGGLKLPDVGFGVFGTARHDNKDSEFTSYVNYYAKFALWVGAKNANGEIRVTAGTGNELTQRPEWAPDFASFTVQEQPPYPQVEKIVSTAYSDAVTFPGHQPLGLYVSQSTYDFRNTGFALLDFEISLKGQADPLEDVYLGLWADVDAPDINNKNVSDTDNVGFASKGKAVFISDSNLDGEEVPLLGAMILGINRPMVSWWNDKEFPTSDADQYAHLKGEGVNAHPDSLGDHRFLLSYGPITLAVGETVHLPVVIVQAPEVADFEDNLADAEEFFYEELDGLGLNKQTPVFKTETAATDLVPHAFQLHQNFPNPFNPETQIRFDLPQASEVKIKIYNTLGQLVRTLVDRPFRAGSHTVIFDSRGDDGRPPSSGIYLYRMTAGTFQAEKKLLLLK